MKQKHLVIFVAFIAVFGLAVSPVDGAKKAPENRPAVDPLLYQAMHWRNIGPYRGGRCAAVTGIPGRSCTFYFGSTGGGVWKTEDGGLNCRNSSDGYFKTGSVGAVAVS